MYYHGVLPKIAESLLLTYLSLNGGYLLNFAYSIPKTLALILLPIFPNIDWFFQTALEYILLVVIFLFVNYETIIKNKKKKRRDIRSENPLKTIPYIFFVIFLVSFITGLLPLRPLAIVSNSMIPEFKRGDVCIVKKVNTKEQIRKIRVGDIIQYQGNNQVIVHRVIKIEANALNIQFIAKGDNNKEQDILPVEEEQILGIVKYKIPYLGYPSVLFSELILK